MAVRNPDDSDYLPSEAEKRRDDVLLRLLKTPPQPRPKREREPKGKAKPESKKSASESR